MWALPITAPINTPSPVCCSCPLPPARRFVERELGTPPHVRHVLVAARLAAEHAASARRRPPQQRLTPSGPSPLSRDPSLSSSGACCEGAAGAL